jgi:ribonuclease HII
MTTLDAEHPGYNFASNKGYGTDEHWAAIRALGPSPVHRRSFRGVGSYQPTLADI